MPTTDCCLSFQSPAEVAAAAVAEAARIADALRLTKVWLLHDWVGLAIEPTGLGRSHDRSALDRLTPAVAVPIDLGLSGCSSPEACCCCGESAKQCGSQFVEAHGRSG
jgi:hypothetical protein